LRRSTGFPHRPWSRRFIARGPIPAARGSTRTESSSSPFSIYGRGDVVVFDVPQAAEEACGAGGTYVKRIIGLPGDRWQERQGFVYVNGKKLDEPYVKKSRRDFQSYPARKIPQDEYFVMGDNRSSSCDSRRWGTVPRDHIIGKVFSVYWPPGRIHLL